MALQSLCLSFFLFETSCKCRCNYTSNVLFQLCTPWWEGLIFIPYIVLYYLATIRTLLNLVFFILFWMNILHMSNRLRNIHYAITARSNIILHCSEPGIPDSNLTPRTSMSRLLAHSQQKVAKMRPLTSLDICVWPVFYWLNESVYILHRWVSQNGDQWRVPVNTVMYLRFP
jgi:hypothetical protein